MAKREYTGDPIDLTQLPKETHLAEQNGETVAGTTEDDNQEENTEIWPSALNKDDFSPSEQEAIKKLCLHPNASYSAVAESVGCSDTIVYNAREKIAEMGLENKVPFEVHRSGKTSPNKSELSAKDWFMQHIAENPEKSATEIASETPEGKDWSVQNYYNVMREDRGAAELKRLLIQKDNWERARDTIKDRLGGIAVDADSGVEQEPEPEDDTEDVESTAVEELEQTVVGLTKKIVAGENEEFTESLLNEVDDSELASAATKVMQNE